MEIERKYKIECLNDLPENYRAFPCHAIEQAYLCTDPWCVCAGRTIPIISYKGKGLLAREEYNLPLTKESYEHLLKSRRPGPHKSALAPSPGRKNRSDH